MKALLIAAAACAALSISPAMAAPNQFRPAPERVQIVPLDSTVAAGALPGDAIAAQEETVWAKNRVAQDPMLSSVLRADGLSLDRVIDVATFPNHHIDIYVSG